MAVPGWGRQEGLQAPAETPPQADLPGGPPLPGDEPLPLLEEPHSSGWSLYVDQDSFIRPSSDKDYTMGFAVELGGARVRDMGGLGGLLTIKPLRGLDRLFRLARLHDARLEDGVQAHSLQLGITAFTPRKGDVGVDPGCERRGCVLALTEPVYGDRPYASLLFVSTRRTTARSRLAWMSELTLGVLGLRVAEAGQTWIHENLTHDVTPGGWPHQISDGGEPTLRYRAGLKALALRVRRCREASGVHCPNEAVSTDANPADDRFFDLTLDAGANAGYYTNLTAGLEARAGLIDSPWWGADREPITSTRILRGRARAVDGSSERLLSEAYLWAGAGGEAWLYNGLLQGQLRDSDVTLSFDPAANDPNVDAPLRRWVGSLQLGVTVRLRWLSLTYQYNLYTPLFDGDQSRRHRWGGIHIGISRRP